VSRYLAGSEDDRRAGRRGREEESRMRGERRREERIYDYDRLCIQFE